MTPIQQLMLGTGGAKKKTYMDDVFSTYLWRGNSTARSINNGINLSGKGGMVWTKTRSAAYHYNLFDTVRTNGRTHSLASSGNAAAGNYGTDGITSFNSNGFSLGTDTQGALNDNNKTYASWSFAKAPGFFDVVTYTGNGSARTIAHSLGSVPGCIMIKCTSQAQDWVVYHRGSHADPEYHALRLNDSIAVFSAAAFNNTLPTSTNFSLGTAGSINGNGETYVAYVFAGGESTAATARSVSSPNNSNYSLSVTSSDFNTGTGDFTYELWVNLDSTDSNYSSLGGTRESNGSNGNGWTLGTNGGSVYVYGSSFYIQSSVNDVYIAKETWYHIALVNHSGTLKLYINGNLADTYTMGSTSFTRQTFRIFNCAASSDQYVTGKISNARFVKGQAIYTSSFKPPTAPLTTTSQGAVASNVKLLCCQNSSPTATTVGGTLTSAGNSGSAQSASTDSPFDDPAGFVFGDAEDQNVIKCGSYVGNGSATGPEINLGWEPQWIMVKNADSSSRDWTLWDSMRGIVTGGDDPRLKPNATEAEGANNAIDLTPTGFKLVNTAANWNENNKTIIYLAIRRPDGYCGKPPALGTDVFAMAEGNSTAPTWISGFPVGFAMYKRYEHVDDWIASARQMQGKYLAPSNSTAQNSHTSFTFDKNNGWNDLSLNSSWLSYMWKRHAGFDVVTYKGNGSSQDIPHSMNKVPEMIWTKRRDGTVNWHVYHKGLNGGTGSWEYYLHLNTDSAEGNANVWNNTPTSSTFSLSPNGDNANGSENIAMLFASVDGISKVGSYTGNGTSGSSTQTITTGFQPRFLIIKRLNQAENWLVFDTARGWGSGNDKSLKLNASDSQGTWDVGAPTSTGFTLVGDFNTTNNSAGEYIYYSHA